MTSTPRRSLLVLASLVVLLPQCTTGPGAALPDGRLVHDVFFRLADPSEANIAGLIRACESLREVPTVLDLATGARHPEMTREVNQTDYHVGLHVVFADRAGLEAYIVHPVHQALLQQYAEHFENVRVFDYTTGAAASTSLSNSLAASGRDPNPEHSSAMRLRYLEIVTPDVDAVCASYSAIHGVEFSEPVPTLGNARTTSLEDGTMVGVRTPMHEQEIPVARPYWSTDDVAAATAAAEATGGEIAVPPMEIPGQGTISIYHQGETQHALWQD